MKNEIKDSSLNWLDVSDLNLESVVDDNARLMCEGQNLMRFIENNKITLSDKDIRVMSIRAVDMLKMSDEARHEMGKLVRNKYPELAEFDGIRFNEDFSEVAGISSRHISSMIRDNKRRVGEMRIAKKTKLASMKNDSFGLADLIDSKVTEMLDIKSTDSHRVAIEKTINSLASGNEELENELVKLMVKSFFSDNPDCNDSKAMVRDSARRFLRKMASEQIKKRAEA